MTTKTAIYVNAAALIVGVLAYLLPLPHPSGAIVLSLSVVFILISIGFGFKALFAHYPAQSFGILGVLAGIVVSIVGFQKGSLLKRLSINDRTAKGAVVGGYVTTSKDRWGNVQSTYSLDVSYRPIEGGEITGSFSVSEAFGRKYVEFRTTDSLNAEIRAANATDPLERISAKLDAVSKRPRDGDVFRGKAKPYVSSDNSVEVRYVAGDPASAIILDAGPPHSYAELLGGAALILVGAGAFFYGIKSRPTRLVLPPVRQRSERAPAPVPKAVAAVPMVFISRNGEQMGPFPRRRLPTLLQNGELLPTDLAWQEGMAEWETLGAMLGKPTA